MSPHNHLSPSNTSNIKRSSDSIERPEPADNKRRRLAFSFFGFMAEHIEEGVVTPADIIQFCNGYDESETHQEMGEDEFDMSGLPDNLDATDYDDVGAEELQMHEDFHPDMDLRNGVRDSVSLASNVNPSPSIRGWDSDSTLSSCATPSPWITPAEFDTPSYCVDPGELVNTLSKFKQSAESLSGDSDDSPAGDMEEDSDKEYEEEEDDEFVESESEDWKTAEEEQEGGGFNESEVTGSRMAADPAEPAETAETVERRTCGNGGTGGNSGTCGWC